MIYVLQPFPPNVDYSWADETSHLVIEAIRQDQETA